MDPHKPDPWSINSAVITDTLLGDWEESEDCHLCPLCGSAIEDPLEECPGCSREEALTDTDASP